MEEKNHIFREKNLKKAAGPEQLDTYIKVTGVRPWILVLAAGLVLAAVFGWLLFGRLKPVITGAGYCSDGILSCYFRQTDMDEVLPTSKVIIKDQEYQVSEISPSLYMYTDLPYEILYLLQEDQWYKMVNIDCNDLEDGLYTALIRGKDIGLFSFLKPED